MAERVLLAVARGATWFGGWGYSFRGGSFKAPTHSNYITSAHHLRSQHVDEVIGGLVEEADRERGEAIIHRSRLDSPGRLTTLGELLYFLLETLPPPRLQNRLGLPAVVDGTADSNLSEDDLQWVYHKLLEGAHGAEYIDVLNGDRWGKEWGLPDREDTHLHLYCQWKPADENRLTWGKASPPIVVVLPPDATIADLKAKARRTFRSTYFAMRRFKVEEVPQLSGRDDGEKLLECALESGSLLIINEGEVDLDGGPDRTGAVYEGGLEPWLVNCMCGAKDDDGEEMASCDTCGVWLHVLCHGIDPEGDFTCAGCMSLPR